MGSDRELPSIDRPVFVIGTGRSGLTPLMDLIAYHRDFGWLSQYNGRYPDRIGVSRLSRAVEFFPFNTRLKFKLLPYAPTHDEAYQFWDRLFRGFSRACRDLEAEDATPHVRSNVLRAIAEVLRLQRKARFIHEYSGWSRVAFLKEIFPDAQFIHIIRDGRAIANSLTHIHWWRGWEGFHEWGLGVPSPDLIELWEKYDRSFLALAGLYWKILVQNLREKTAGLGPAEHLLVRYEDLVADPRAAARESLLFAGLNPDAPKFKAHLSTVDIVDANTKTFRIPDWQANMSPAQIRMLDDILGEELAHYGYV